MGILARRLVGLGAALVVIIYFTVTHLTALDTYVKDNQPKKDEKKPEDSASSGQND
jgi:hypothetical protein